MRAKSAIAWCDYTSNFWLNCKPVSDGCKNCCARRDADYRFHHVIWGSDERPRIGVTARTLPLQWNQQASLSGEVVRVFANFWSDFFDKQAHPAVRTAAWNMIRMCSSLTWLILTKRPQNILKMLPDDWVDGWDHVVLGVSVENQTEADRRIPILLAVPARRRFISFEPLLDAITLHPEWLADGRLSWGIIGGESGTGARPMDPAWARAIRDQLAVAGVAIFFKQTGSNRPPGLWPPGIRGHGTDPAKWPADLRIQEFPA
jgi:protein gp37